MSDTTVREHFSDENVAVLKRAYEIICEISYEGPVLRDWKDVCVIERAEIAASSLSRMISSAEIFFGLLPEPQSLKVTP